MKFKGKPVLILALAMALALILEFAYYVYVNNREDPIRQVSLIVYGSDSARWENLKQGAELAAGDLHAEVTLITMSSEADAMEQISLIEREIKNGADALLIAACDAKAVGEYMEHAKPKIPYLFVESGTFGEDLLSADDEQMAKSLAATIAENEKDWIKAALIVDHTERDSVKKRLDAIQNAEPFADEVVLWERNAQEQNKKAQFFLQRELTEEAVDVVVALDNSSMEELLDATVNLNKDIKIYGIANSSKSVYYLDNRLIKSLVYQDEFSIGYLGMTNVLSEKSNATEELIRYEVVDHDDMYNETYQKLLFPHVR
ncbi:MAG: substrate-binding domain-containing protein [Lachnospiraceae bacterium]|nr:substrate-binding domain-containing protein [Lachnospiraceae bacterium]